MKRREAFALIVWVALVGIGTRYLVTRFGASDPRVWSAGIISLLLPVIVAGSRADSKKEKRE